MRKQVKKKKRHIGIILVITTICLMTITTLLEEMNLTKLDITYLYMLIFLCVKTISQDGGD